MPIRWAEVVWVGGRWFRSPFRVQGEIAMNPGNSPMAGLPCGVTLRDLGLCTLPVAILFASILTLL